MYPSWTERNECAAWLGGGGGGDFLTACQDKRCEDVRRLQETTKAHIPASTATDGETPSWVVLCLQVYKCTEADPSAYVGR